MASYWRSQGSAILIPASWVVEEGALANQLLVDGDPLQNIHLIENPDKNFLVIMKDGKIFKNLTVERGGSKAESSDKSLQQ